MNRRGFLKFLGIGAGAAAVAPKIVAESPKSIVAFRPTSSPRIRFPYEAQEDDKFLTGPYAEGGWIGDALPISGVGRPDPLLLTPSERHAAMRIQIASHYMDESSRETILNIGRKMEETRRGCA